MRLHLILSAIASVLLPLLASPAANADTPNMKPGLWETTVTMEMQGGPKGMASVPPQTERHCVHPGDTDDYIPQSGAGQCDVKKRQKGANTMTWTVQCNQNGVVSKGYGENTFNGDSSTGFFDVTMTGGPMGDVKMKSRFKSRRLGGC